MVIRFVISSDVKTLIDGGKYGGDANFPVSYVLTSSQEKVAKLARFEVEYTEKPTCMLLEKMKRG